MQETEKKQKYISYLHGRWFVSTLSLPVLFDTITDHLRSTNWGRSISKHQKQVETINQSINQSINKQSTLKQELRETASCQLKYVTTGK